MEYPKLREKYGNRVTYAQSPKSHVLVEFSFDVVQLAAGAYASETYHQFIGFEVAMPALERAFRATYGVEMRDLFPDLGLAIGTDRHAVSTIIPEMTKVAWRDKREDSLADKTYVQLVARLADHDFEDAPKDLVENITAFFGHFDVLPGDHSRQHKKSAKLTRQLGLMEAASRAPASPSGN